MAWRVGWSTRGGRGGARAGGAEQAGSYVPIPPLYTRCAWEGGNGWLQKLYFVSVSSRSTSSPLAPGGERAPTTRHTPPLVMKTCDSTVAPANEKRLSLHLKVRKRESFHTQASEHPASGQEGGPAGGSGITRRTLVANHAHRDANKAAKEPGRCGSKLEAQSRARCSSFGGFMGTPAHDATGGISFIASVVGRAWVVQEDLYQSISRLATKSLANSPSGVRFDPRLLPSESAVALRCS